MVMMHDDVDDDICVMTLVMAVLLMTMNHGDDVGIDQFDRWFVLMMVALLAMVHEDAGDQGGGAVVDECD